MASLLSREAITRLNYDSIIKIKIKLQFTFILILYRLHYNFKSNPWLDLECGWWSSATRRVCLRKAYGSRTREMETRCGRRWGQVSVLLKHPCLCVLEYNLPALLRLTARGGGGGSGVRLQQEQALSVGQHNLGFPPQVRNNRSMRTARLMTPFTLPGTACGSYSLADDWRL